MLEVDYEPGAALGVGHDIDARMCVLLILGAAQSREIWCPGWNRGFAAMADMMHAKCCFKCGVEIILADQMPCQKRVFI